MSSHLMLDNIYGQPASHRGIIELSQTTHHAALLICAERIRLTRGRIVFSGMGASLFAALPAVSRLQHQGYGVQAIESAELLHYSSATLRPDDTGVLISRSGASVEVLRLAQKMRSIGMFVIGASNVPNSKLQDIADVCLMIGAQADQLVAVQTYTGTVLALLLLAEEVVTHRSSALGDFCLSSLPALSAFIEHGLHASDSWREIFDGPSALYLLGRGPALASVHEGALLMHETAKVAAVGMSSGQFRHGPVEVVSGEFRAVIFGTALITRAVDHALAIDLLKMGAKIRWVGPTADLLDRSDHVQQLVAWPDLGSHLDAAHLLAPLFDIIPLQLAAYRLALWRGITPGDFRYASEITAEESGFPLFQAKSSTL